MATISVKNNAATKHAWPITFNLKLPLVDDNPRLLGMLQRGLLMEGLRLLDEFTRDGAGEAEPASSAPLRSPVLASAPVSPKQNAEEDVLVDG